MISLDGRSYWKYAFMITSFTPFTYYTTNLPYFWKEAIAMERLPNGEVIDDGKFRTRFKERLRFAAETPDRLV